MTSIRVFRRGGRIDRVIAEGHAGFAVEGKDIVCAAISAILETALLGLKKFGIDVRAVRDERKGFLEFWFPRGIAPEQERTAEVILETMYAGLADVVKDYPRYSRLEDQ